MATAQELFYDTLSYLISLPLLGNHCHRRHRNSLIGKIQAVSGEQNIGYEFGIGAGSLDPSSPNYDRDNWLVGIVNAAPYIGSGFIGCWLSGTVNYFLGRRGTMFVSAIFSNRRGCDPNLARTFRNSDPHGYRDELGRRKYRLTVADWASLHSCSTVDTWNPHSSR